MSSLESALSNSLKTALSAQSELVNPSNDPGARALSNSLAQGIPPIAISSSQGTFLSILCQLINAKNVLEIGTLGGYSTIWFAKSVPGVKVTSIEFNANHRDVALENVKNAGCEGNVEILLGKALDVMPGLEGGEKFDFVFIDADWDEQREYFDWAVRLTRKGGCIYVDNVVRQLNEAEEGGSTKARALIEHVKGDDRVNASLIPTLATHKTKLTETVDGYLIAIVK